MARNPMLNIDLGFADEIKEDGATLSYGRGNDIEKPIADDLCPKCRKPLVTKWSGIKCSDPKCNYWFCY